MQPITIKRKWYTDTTTIGELYINNEFICHTLEDTIRDPNKDGKLQKSEKVYGVTAIPSGVYEVVFTYSPHLKCKVPMLLSVKHFNRIYFHAGNKDKDTLGCILVGVFDSAKPDLILDSRSTFKMLMEKLEKEMNHRRLYVEIQGGPTA